jgi:hypothetical protein
MYFIFILESFVWIKSSYLHVCSFHNANMTHKIRITLYYSLFTILSITKHDPAEDISPATHFYTSQKITAPHVTANAKLRTFAELSLS